MGKYLICLMGTIMMGMATAFADIEHTVARGESLESIAEKYGITTDKLLDINEDAKTLFYIGQKLTIPTIETNGDDTSENSHVMGSLKGTISPIERNLAEDAKRHFEYKEWGKAVKTYNKLVKEYPKSIYFYNRALSHFNNNKYRQAANDFEKALSMDDCTSSMREKGPKLLAEAQKRHREWKERQLNAIGSAILGVAAVGLSTWAAVESSKAESANKEYMNSGASSYSSSDNSANTYSNDRKDDTPKTKKKEKCGFCGGKGSTIKYTASFANPDKWCDECGKTVVSGHYHMTCTHCNGTGER